MPDDARAEAARTTEMFAPPLEATAPPRDTAAASGEALEVSVVIPCLNESETVAVCIRKAKETFAAHQIAGEVIVADNGSSDGSREIAAANAARIVHVPARGYGSTLQGGIDAARGAYVIMADADDSYDFREIPKFLARLREGYDLVQGCRMPSGGGRIDPGAMPFLHRYWGNPMFSAICRRWFGVPLHDVNCGMRGFRTAWQRELDQRCTGMEFAPEMVIKASMFGSRIAEVPITLHRDGRKTGTPHLRTFRDGWRTLRFLLMYSPRWLFLLPGIGLIALGVIGYAVALPRLTIGDITFDVHTLLFASLFVICGYQSIWFAVVTKTFAISEGLLPTDPRMERAFHVVTLERGLMAGAVAVVVGSALLLIAINEWRLTGFGALDYTRTLRQVIPGVTFATIGVQTMLSSFLMSILGLRRR